jgi:hypothetical protein
MRLKTLALIILFMARIRTIKPEFFTSEDIVGLSPLARLLYIALWCEADKEGRMVWKPKTFKMRYLPADDCDIDALCDEIVGSGLVRLYGDLYAVIPAFAAHQHINPRETPSQLPEPDALVTRRSRVPHASARDSDAQGGRERKGKEEETRDASELPPGFAEFWAKYPNKAGRKHAIKAWQKLSPSEGLQASILKALQWQCQGEAWVKEGGRFVPHASTYLNGERWLDEPPQAAAVIDIFAGAR